jgi:hypothetical protein
MRQGQRVSIYEGPATLKGKRRTLVVHYRSEWVDGGNGYNVGTGTWKVLRGTGQYAHVTGGGRTGNVWLERGRWSSRDEASSPFRSALHETGNTRSRAARLDNKFAGTFTGATGLEPATSGMRGQIEHNDARQRPPLDEFICRYFPREVPSAPHG